MLEPLVNARSLPWIALRPWHERRYFAGPHHLRYASEQARPIVQSILRSRIGADAGERNGLQEEVMLRLIERLYGLRQHPEAAPITDFRSYVATVSYHVLGTHRRQAAAGNNPPTDPAAAQAWVMATLASNGHFAVGIEAVRLDSACQGQVRHTPP
jgi:hypothetical protein